MKILLMHEFHSWVQGSVEDEMKYFEKVENWFKKHQEEGKCLEVHCNASTGGIVSIWEVATPEEGLAIGFLSPLKAHSTVTAHPLLSVDTLKAQLMKSLKK